MRPLATLPTNKAVEKERRFGPRLALLDRNSIVHSLRVCPGDPTSQPTVLVTVIVVAAGVRVQTPRGKG